MSVHPAVCDGGPDLDRNSTRQLAEVAVRQFYACEGMPPPKLVVWLRSPIEGAMGAALLTRVKCCGPSAMGRQLWDLLGLIEDDALFVKEHVVNSIRSQVWSNAWEMVGRDLGHQIDMRISERATEMPSQHYRVWPHIGAKSAVEDLSTAELLDEINATLPPWESPEEMEIANLLRQKAILNSQYALGESGRAIAHCLEYLANEAKSDKFNLSGSVIPLSLAQHPRTKALYQIAQNCGWIWCFEGACILTERDQVTSRDSMGRLHCEDGPALKFADGTAFCLWHGIQVPPWVIKTPELISVELIDGERNSELRRIMIERYGLARYVVNSGFQSVESIPPNHPIVGLRTANLWVQRRMHDEPIVYVDLLNSTAEPDGTTKRYMLRVDPFAYAGDTLRYAHAAAASTWRNVDGQLIYPDWRDYAPSFES